MSFFEELKRRNVFRVAIGYFVVAWLMMQIGDTLGPALRLPEWIPSALAFFLILGFPIAMYLAWVYDMTPDGLKLESENSKSGGHATDSRKLNKLIIVIALIAVAYFAVDRIVLKDGDEKTEHSVSVSPLPSTAGTIEDQTRLISVANAKSIAVLPFVNMSSDPEQEYFSDGLSEELLNLLARIPELQVTSRSSAFAYKGKAINIPKVAASLGVAHILEGSVRKSGNQIRITAQLIDAKRDIHLWTETYDRQLDNVFAIQDEISEAVVDALKVTILGDRPKARMIDPVAMDLNLQASFLWNRRGEGDAIRARELYEQSLEIDPHNAPAWAGLAVIYSELARRGMLPPEEGKRLFKNAAARAVEADPEYPEGHIRLAWAYSREGKTEQAARHERIAAQLDPNNDLVLFNQMVKYLYIGRIDRVVEIAETLVRIDPLSAINWGNLGSYYIDAGRYEDAEAAILRAQALSPTSANSYLNLAKLRILQGRYEEAKAFAESVPDSNSKHQFLSMAHEALGNKQASQQAFNLIEDSGIIPAQSWHLPIHAFRGEIDKAFRIIEAAFEQGITYSLFVNEPLLKGLHSDPRWERMMREAGWDPKAGLD